MWFWRGECRYWNSNGWYRILNGKILGMGRGGLLVGLLLWVAACKSDGSDDTAVPDFQRDFGPPQESQIRPGVSVSSSYGNCTSNFLYAENEVTYYLGVAAHCFSEDADTVDPCEARTAPAGFSEIEIQNATRPGVLAYSSWSAMQQQGESAGSSLCQFNDFALIRIHPDDIPNVHPAAIHFGGPTALYTGTAAVGDTVYTYGQSELHFGARSLERKIGRITEVIEEGLAYRVQTDSAGLPGDSGSAVLHEDGRALAVLVNIGVGAGPTPVSNGVVGLERALAYAKAGGFVAASTRLLTWPEFSPSGNL